MRRSLALAVLVLLAVPVTAFAATFTLSGSILYVLRLPVAIELPDPAPHLITVEVRFFNSGNGNPIPNSGRSEGPFEVPEGGSYTIGWDGNGNLVTCDSVNYPGPLPDLRDATANPYTPTADASHFLCIRTASGGGGDRGVTFDVTAPDGGGGA